MIVSLTWSIVMRHRINQQQRLNLKFEEKQQLTEMNTQLNARGFVPPNLRVSG